MARIRTLKPECLQHRKVGRLSDRAFRLWVGLILQADDHGRLVADTEQLRLLIFGFHPEVTAGALEEALRELTRVGLVTTYRDRGVRYAAFPSWTHHQKVDHPTDSRLPAPPLARARESSRGLANVLDSPRAGARIGSEGSNRIGSEAREESRAPVAAPSNGPGRSRGARPVPKPGAAVQDWPPEDRFLKLSGALHRVVRAWGEAWRERFADWPALRRADVTAAGDLIREHGADAVLEILPGAMRTGTRWMRQADAFTLAGIRQAWNDLAQMQAKGELR